MRAIIQRLRRLEKAAAPGKWELINHAIAERIMEARRRRLGPDYKPTSFPPEIYAGCRTIAERIIRAREFRMEQGAADSKRGIAAGGENWSGPPKHPGK
jgi:hypothetical protein